ncbi:MAG: bifunctional heptose 7-phosphate kinase/heptose 1-phosphate adenyltransferase [Acidobacteriota bacterium]
MTRARRGDEAPGPGAGPGEPAPTRAPPIGAIDRMDGVEVLVVGDLVLDEFEYGEIGRVSREAPVLILNHQRTETLLGAAANAVHNIHALGGRPIVVGRVGQDAAGERITELLRERGIEIAGIWRDPGYRTPRKRRILAGSPHAAKQQIVRIDRGGGPPVPADAPQLRRRLEDGARRARGALVSDYGLGLIHDGTRPAILELTRGAGLSLFVDSRARLASFRPLTAATPNLEEVERALGETVGEEVAAVHRAGERLRRELDARALVVTLGSHGMSVLEAGRPPVHLAVYGTDEVADVTGAGDTVISAFTLAALAGSGYLEAALLANYAGGIVVMKRGTATVAPDELRRAVRTDPLFEGRLRAT